MHSDISLSVVITTYNRSSGLRQLLNAFAQQAVDNFQVVVAVDGSTDDTESMIKQQSQPYDLKSVNTNCTGYGLAVARNQGILAADGRAVVVLDDDSFPCAGFIEAHCASVTSGVITGGPRNPSDPIAAPLMAWKMAELSTVPACVPKSIPQMRLEHPTAWLIENNICLLREDWIAMGLFSERLKMYGYIGQEFFARAEYLGLKYQYNPEARVVHHGEMEGDNGITREKKIREARRAALIRPSLEKARHFEAQISWAKAMAEGRQPQDFPPFIVGATLAWPYRVVRRQIGLMRKNAKNRKES